MASPSSDRRPHQLSSPPTDRPSQDGGQSDPGTSEASGPRHRPWALITGADGGIGRAVAARLHERGYRLILVERDTALANQAVSSFDHDAEAVACDLANQGQLQDLCRRIEGEWAPDLEVVIANAGVIAPSDLSTSTPEAIDLTIAVNLAAPLHLARSAIRAFSPRSSGHFLATVSMGGVIALPGSAAYSASKAGLRAALASLHAEVVGTGIRVSGIYPSAVDTPMLRMEARGNGSPLNFLGTVYSPADVADAYERALDSGDLEVFVPFHDSLATRLLMLKPSLLPRLMPILNRVGERGRDRFLARVGEVRQQPPTSQTKGPQPHTTSTHDIG